MITVCAWCQKYMGSKEPLQDPAVTHGICNDCMERDSLDDAPVLVVSPRRAEAIPMLQSLLRGAPEIAIVLDRRASERRAGHGKGPWGRAPGSGSATAPTAGPRTAGGRPRSTWSEGARQPRDSRPKTRSKTASTWVR
jgi:hypothetical protein